MKDTIKKWTVPALIAVIVALAVVVVLLLRRPVSVVSNFEQCKKEVGVILESYPEQCSIQGTTFTNTAQVVDTPDDTASQDETKQQETDSSTQQGETSASSPKADENDSIVAAVGAYAHTRVDGQNAKLGMQVTKKELPFARVIVTPEEGVGGYACVLKQSDTIWVVLFCGQGVPLQSDLDTWGVPATMVQS